MGLAPIKAHETNIDKISRYFSSAIASLSQLRDDELAEFYGMLSKVIGRAWKTECAVIYELVRRVSEREESGVHGIVAEMLGISRSTVYTREAIWRIFFQDNESREVRERQHEPYIFEDSPEGSSWFALALSCPDPVGAIRMAERRVREFQAIGRRYTLRDFRSDLNNLRAEERHGDEFPVKRFEPEQGSLQSYLEGGVIRGEYRSNIRQAAKYVEKAITSLADEIVMLIDADGRILERTAASLNVLVSDLRTVMYELRLLLGEATPLDVRSSIEDRFCRMDHSPILDLINDLAAEGMKEERTVDVEYQIVEDEDEDTDNG